MNSRGRANETTMDPFNRENRMIPLLADAIVMGFSEFEEKAHLLLKNVAPQDWWKEIVRWYLSPEHCSHPDTGCPVATLAPDIARAKLSIRKRVAGQVKGLLEEWVEFMPGVTTAERERNFFVIFSAMAGAVSIARILTEPADRQKVLASMREHLLHSF